MALPIEVVAYRMFERWTQENFVRYIRQHFALDALATYAVEPADVERTIPNPARKALKKAITEARATLKELEHQYGQQARTNTEACRPTMRGFKIAHADLNRQITALETKITTLKARLAALPPRVPVTAVLDEAEIVQPAPEAKHVTDTIKMVAFRAETALVRALTPHYRRTEDEGRALIREIEEFVRAMARKADAKELPPAGGPPSQQAIEALTGMAKRFGIAMRSSFHVTHRPD